MCRVNSCCFCVDLEKGGKIWGWLGIIGGILGLLTTGFKIVPMFQKGELVETVNISLILIQFKMSYLASLESLTLCCLSLPF
jgi:nicotinamide riboside transporter PnuC